MCVRGWGGISTCVCVGGGGISTCVCVHVRKSVHAVGACATIKLA